jgi:hypothetical protein
MTFFKLPSLLFQRKKANADDLERLFMLPEQQRSSPVYEKIFSAAVPQKKNLFQVTNTDIGPEFSGKTESETLSQKVFNAINEPANPTGVLRNGNIPITEIVNQEKEFAVPPRQIRQESPHREQILPEKTHGEIVQDLPIQDRSSDDANKSAPVIPQIPTDNVTESFQLQTRSISKNDTVSLQKKSGYHSEYVFKEKEEPYAPMADNSPANFQTVKRQSVNSVENRPMRVSPASIKQETEFFHPDTQEPQQISSIPETPFPPTSSDSKNQMNSNHVLQLNSNLNTLTNYAKNQLRYLKKNCELLQNQDHAQTFN